MNKNYLIKRELFILNREHQIKDHYEFIKVRMAVGRRLERVHTGRFIWPG